MRFSVEIALTWGSLVFESLTVLVRYEGTMTRIFISLIASITLFLSACTEESLSLAGSGAGKTDEERALEQKVGNLNQQTRDIVARNTIQGVLAGAAVGCAIGAIFGNSDDCARGAAAGAVVGGVAGNQVGKRAAEANRKLRIQREILANLRGINTRLNAVEADLRRVVRNQNAELSSLRRQLQNKQLSASAYNNRVAAIQSNRKTIVNGLGKAEQNVANSRGQLVSLEKQGAGNLSQQKTVAASTQRRLSSLRKSVRLVSS